MPNYILAYHGGKKPETPEEGAEGMAKFQAWVRDLGDAAINPGTPLGMSKTVSADGISRWWRSKSHVWIFNCKGKRYGCRTGNR